MIFKDSLGAAFELPKLSSTVTCIAKHINFNNDDSLVAITKKDKFLRKSNGKIYLHFWNLTNMFLLYIT